MILVKQCVLAAVLLAGIQSVYADTCEAPDRESEYELVFADEFDGNSLDLTTWSTQFLWGPGVIINNEEQYYVNEGQFGYNPFHVADGVLSIEAIKTEFDRSQLYLTSSIYSATSAELLWRKPVNAVAYQVYRDGELQATVTGGSYFEPLIREGIDYAYEIVALDENDNRLVAAQLTINTADRPRSPPAKPFSLELTARVYSATSGEISWQPPNRAGSFEVYLNDELYRELGSANYRSIYESALEEGEDYNYRVVALDRCGEIIIEQSVTLNTGDGVTPPQEDVARLVINVNEYSKTTAEISWTTVEGGSTYDIYEDDAFVENTAGRSVFIDDLVPGVDRRFRVVVLDADGNELDQTGRVINTADNSFALNRQPFLSGIITSYNSFRFLYGYVEMRAKMPAGKGLWSAFWLLNAYYNQDQPADPEIDIMEAIGDDATTANVAYHYLDVRDGEVIGRVTDEGKGVITDFSANYHVYAVDWSEGLIIWYVDGVEIHRLEGDSVSSEQMYVLANLAVGGEFPGPPDESTVFPAKYEIDYIRVYQQ